MFYKYFKAFRVAEVLMLTGFFLIGTLFAIDVVDHSTIKKLIHIAVLAFSIYSGLYAFNALADQPRDQYNKRLASLVGISFSTYLIYFLLCLILGLTLGYFLDNTVLFLMFLLIVIGVAYSWPATGLKNLPFAGSVTHFAFQIIAFNATYSVFQSMSIESILLSFYFSLIFAAGHLHHEVIDHDADKATMTNTSAVYLGLRKGAYLSFAIFTIAIVYWFILYISNTISILELLLFSAAYIGQLLAFIKTQRSFEVNTVARIAYRTTYRTLYLLSGIILLSVKAYQSL